MISNYLHCELTSRKIDLLQIFTEKDFHYLEIVDVTTEDRGQYTCVIANSLGTTRVTAELEVYGKRRHRVTLRTSPIY